MKRAFLDIFISTAVVLLGLFLTHFMMRQNGLARPIENVPSGWWTNHLILAQEYSKDAFDHTHIKLLTEQFESQNVIILPQVTISASTKAPGLKLVQDILESQPKKPLLINVLNYTFGIDKELMSLVKMAKSQDQIIIRSPYDNIIREIRRQEPEWNLGSGDGETSRFFILSSLALEMFPPLSGTFYFLNFSKGTHYSSERMLAEIRRRQLILFIETSTNEKQWQKALENGANGIITPSVAEFLNWYSARTL